MFHVRRLASAVAEVCCQKRHLCTSVITVFPHDLFKTFPAQGRGEVKGTEKMKQLLWAPTATMLQQTLPTGLNWSERGSLCWHNEQVRVSEIPHLARRERTVFSLQSTCHFYLKIGFTSIHCNVLPKWGRNTREGLK